MGRPSGLRLGRTADGQRDRPLGDASASRAGDDHRGGPGEVACLPPLVTFGPAFVGERTPNIVDMTDLAVRELDRTECLALLATTNLGRLALTRRALPTIVPARYLVNDERVVIHLSTGLDHVAWLDGEVVALQVSAFDDTQTYGWSVCITGAAHGTPDPVGAGNSSGHPEQAFRST
jgi:hypothetical protein